jgi:hypothetical protein
MPKAKRKPEDYIISYAMLRSIIGYLGMGLPVVLIVGDMLVFKQFVFRDSISAYYHSDVGDVLVGALCAIGVFLLSYRGPERKDDIAGDLACGLAVGVALFPVAMKAACRTDPGWVGTLHYLFAAGLFGILAYFCLALFTKTGNRRQMTARKKARNKVYIVCGYVIIASIALIAAHKFNLLPDVVVDLISPIKPVFFFETVAIEFFGLSWLVKGEQILGDRPVARRTAKKGVKKKTKVKKKR